MQPAAYLARATRPARIRIGNRASAWKHDAAAGHGPWRRSLGVTALLDRARIAETAGHLHDARRHYALFADVFDRPDPGLEALRAEAIAGLARLVEAPPGRERK